MEPCLSTWPPTTRYVRSNLITVHIHVMTKKNQKRTKKVFLILASIIITHILLLLTYELLVDIYRHVRIDELITEPAKCHRVPCLKVRRPQPDRLADFQPQRTRKHDEWPSFLLSLSVCRPVVVSALLSSACSTSLSLTLVSRYPRGGASADSGRAFWVP